MCTSSRLILITGEPRIGKTTILEKVAQKAGDRLAGFYTREVRVNGQRDGFEVVTLDGERSLLATRDPDIAFVREAVLGKYRVDLDAIEQVAVPAIHRAIAQGRILLVDEIGPMEALSVVFCQTVRDVLEQNALVGLGSIVERRHPFTDEVKAHPGVSIWRVDRSNRDVLPDVLAKQLFCE